MSMIKSFADIGDAFSSADHSLIQLFIASLNLVFELYCPSMTFLIIFDRCERARVKSG